MRSILKRRFNKQYILCLTFMTAFALVSVKLSAQVAECPPSVILPCDKVNMNPQVSFELETPFYETGDTIRIFLKADKFEFVNTLQFTLSFNASHMQYINTLDATLKDIVKNSESADNGNVAIIWFNSSGRGICTDVNATLLIFEFLITDANVSNSSITLSNNISEMEAGVTLDIAAPTCSMDIDVEKFFLPNICNQLSTTIDICNPELNQDFAVINISACGGVAPFLISSEAFQPFTSDAFESTNVLIDDFVPDEPILITITDEEGAQLDTFIQLSLVEPMEVLYTVNDPSCINSSDGSIIIEAISGGLKDKLTNYEVIWSNEVFSDFDNTGLANGDYAVTIIDQMGCELIETFTLETEAMSIENLEVDYSCDENGTVTFNVVVPNEFDDIAQVLVRDQNFVNYPNEFSTPDEYRNTNIPAGLYLITVFSENGCSVDTSFILYKDFTRLGGTLFIDQNENGDLDDTLTLADIPVTLLECDGNEDIPLFTFNTTDSGDFAFIIPQGIYKFGIHRDVFQEDGQLAQYQIPNSAPSPQNDQDNDNNGYRNEINAEYALITDCVFVNCPENVTGTSENMAVDLGVFRAFCDLNTSVSTVSEDSCEDLAQVSPYCDISDLSGQCYSLNESQSIVNDITPICMENETLDNGSWFSFIAPSGDLQILISPLSCLQGRCGELGMHMGVFLDCDLQSPIWCSEGPCIPKELITPVSLFTPGERYYFFVDGCGGALCDFEILTICNDVSCDPFSGITGIEDLVVTTCDDSEEYCINKPVEFLLPANINGQVIFEWVISDSNGSLVESFTSEDNLTVVDFEEAGTYEVCVTATDACGDAQRCTEITITSADIVDFPIQEVCGPITFTPTFTDEQGNTYSWPVSISLQKNLTDEVNSIMLKDTVMLDCACQQIYMLNIEVQPDSSSVIDSLTCIGRSNSVEFSWLQDENTSQYQITVLTGQSGVFNPLGPSLSITGLAFNELVELEILAINNTDCGEDFTGIFTCVSDGTSVLDTADDELRIYPNPVSDRLYIDSSSEDILTYYILTLEGQLLRKDALRDFIPVDQLTEGMYIIALENANGQLAYRRFFKMK